MLRQKIVATTRRHRTPPPSANSTQRAIVYRSERGATNTDSDQIKRSAHVRARVVAVVCGTHHGSEVLSQNVDPSTHPSAVCQQHRATIVSRSVRGATGTDWHQINCRARVRARAVAVV